MDNPTHSTKSNDTFFYKYQSLKVAVDDDGKVVKDDKGNDVIYTIQNLANNQLFFNRPDKFNDPLDSRPYWCLHGRKEKYINSLMCCYNNLSRNDIEQYIQDSIDRGDMEEEGDLIFYDPIVEKDLKLRGYSFEESLPKICCFSGTCRNILMWSHYADYHRGICLRFRSAKDWENIELGEHYLDFDYRDYSTQLLLAKKDPFHNLFYKKKFLKVEYKPKEYICPMVNYLDTDSNLEMVKSLLNKFCDWHYEDEYRMIITRYDIINGLLSSDEFENGLLKYQKEDLGGIVFGMKITYENAKLIYETIKENYLDQGINVNFYEAKEVPRKYEIKICEIKDIDTYLDSRQ